MGSGKTTLGKKLARLLNKNFVDLDAFIEGEEKKSIADIFKHQGESAFRNLEAIYLRQIISRDPATVVALGGGTICFEGNLELIKKSGLLIFLDVPVPTLAKRLEPNAHSRPLLKELPPDKIQGRISELLEQRLVYYHQAHLKVKGSDITPDYLYEQMLDYKKK